MEIPDHILFRVYREMMKKRRIIIFTILIIFCLGSVISLLLSWKALSVSYYEYHNAKIENGFKIVQLSDLHNSRFGKENSRLIKTIEKEEPDLILMTGDMLNGYEERIDIVTDLIKQVSQIAPVYYSLGNHELEYMENQENGGMLEQKLEDAGAVVLEKEYIDTVIAGQQVRIGGVYGYVIARDWEDGSEQRFMEDFQDTDRLKILMSHIPEGLLLWKSMEHWDVDLVFSGHVHGGQMRLPFIGGLFDPEEGFFPTYTKGMYECGPGTMILSAGLGSSNGVPRINNLPDVVVCTVEGGEQK